MADRELADFHPSTGHLHECYRTTIREECNSQCAEHLYAIAQDAEQAIAQVRLVLAEWDRLTKAPSPTTTRIREALEVHHG